MSDDDPFTSEEAISVLLEFSRLASDAQVSADVLPRLAEVAAERLADGAAVLRYDERGELSLAAHAGVPPEVVAVLEQATEVGAELELAVQRACRRGCNFPSTVPLVSSGGLYGALLLLSVAPFEPSHVRLAEALADLAALALDKAHQYEALERAAAALRASREELASTETLRALGQMAAVVAHEVKNPLASIGGVLQILQGRFPEGSKDREVLHTARARLRALGSMVDELLLFARPQQMSLGAVDVFALLGDAREVVLQNPSFSELEMTLLGAPCSLRADPTAIRGVFLNLLLNAAQASEGKGRVDVRLTLEEEACRVDIADCGPGVPADLRERIFEPFFTSKTRGTGLGLAIAKRVITQHGGTIAVQEAPGGGALFQVRLPLPGATPAPAPS